MKSLHVYTTEISLPDNYDVMNCTTDFWVTKTEMDILNISIFNSIYGDHFLSPTISISQLNWQKFWEMYLRPLTVNFTNLKCISRFTGSLQVFVQKY